MMTVIETNIVPIIIVLVVGLVVGWWMFARSARAEGTETADKAVDTAPKPAAAPPPTKPAPKPATAPKAEVSRHEGQGIADQGAAATTDVAGQMLGVEAHGELPGAKGPPDDLQLLKGVGPKLVLKLHENGITRFDQIARLSPNEVAILEDKLGPFKGRLTRDRVVEQAAYLARGDRDGFEAQFGSLGSK